jgi:hypothetical protein
MMVTVLPGASSRPDEAASSNGTGSASAWLTVGALTGSGVGAARSTAGLATGVGAGFGLGLG